MRAGLAASARWFGCFGPGAACEAMLRLRGYGFVLQPTGARQRCSRICTYQITGRVSPLRAASGT